MTTERDDGEGPGPATPERLRRIIEMAGGTLPEEARPAAAPQQHSAATTAREKILNRARKYVARIDPGVMGEHGSNPTFRAACTLVIGFGLSIDEARPIMQEYSQRCSPPWSEREIEHKLADAFAQPGPRGDLLVDNRHAGNGAAPAPAAPSEVVSDTEEERIIVLGSEITPRVVEWLWPSRIPLAKLTTFAGQTAQGKTFVACDIAARVTRGGDWPDGSPAVLPPRKVLYITGDDDVDDTLVPRFIEAGAVMERVVFLTEKAQAAWFMSALGTLTRALEQAEGEVALVVIDPPTSFTHGTDSHKNDEVRILLTPFKVWARAQNVAVVFITHVNKGGAAQVDAIARVMGSVAWVSGVRAAYMFAAHPDTPGQQLFLTLKNNLAPKSKGLVYHVVQGALVGKVEWIGGTDVTADEAMRQAKKKPRAEVASEWLVERFREKRSWQSEELIREGHAQGISRNAIFEAKKDLDITARKVAMDGITSWLWIVSDDWPHLQAQSDPECAQSDEDCEEVFQ